MWIRAVLQSAQCMESAEPKYSPGRSNQQKKLVAVLFADMVGYSKHIEQDEIENSDRAGRSIDLFKSLIADYGGQVSNVSGDGILALFESAELALRFAVQIQMEFRDQSAWGDGDPIQFRIGLNLGEVILQDGHVRGHCVNVAARIQALAEPNTILATAAIRSMLREVPGLTWRSRGPQNLKNISEPIEVFAVDPSNPAGPSVELARAAAPPEPFRSPSVAVLALSNLSGDPRNDHLCDGIAEDIIASLSHFRNLLVIARRSAFLFDLRTNPAREVQRRLGVRYILVGSLRRADKRLRIAVEDLFDVQEEIAGSVASRLSIQIDFAERRRESPYPRDMRAYGLVTRGQHMILRFNKEANSHARRLFEEAIEIAPDYSRAQSAISRTHNLDWRYAWSAAPEASLDAAIAFARRATGLDRLDARGFAELGNAKLYKKQHDESLAEYAHAIALNPNDSDIIAEYADALVYAGEPRRSIELLEKAMRLNPFFPDWYLWYLADAYNAMGQPANVISTVLRMQDPSEGRRLLAANYAHLGMTDEAHMHAREVLRLHPGFTLAQWRHRPPYRDVTIIDRYVEGLRKAGLPD
jgi:adenylate cyclase